MAAAAIPAISMGAQYFMNRGKNKKIAAAQDAATAGLQTSSQDLNKFGDKMGDTAGSFLGDAQKQFGRANTSLDASANYFSPLLRGGRAAIDQTLAPERAGITETYRGAGKALEQSGMRGGTRDLASAELNRDRASKLALLPSAARAGAAESMMKLGGEQGNLAATQAGTGANLYGGAATAKGTGAYGYNALLGSADRREYVQGQNAQTAGTGIGSMIFDAIKSKQGKSAGGGSGGGGMIGGLGNGGGGFLGVGGG